VTRFAANVGFLYRDLAEPARPAAARADGFEAIESAWPGAPEPFARAVIAAGVRVALLNVAAGDLDAGERGHANDPAAVERWRDDFRAALALADAVGCPTLNVLAGNRLHRVALDDQWATLVAHLRWALPLAAREERRLVVELLNPVDTPRYLVTDLGAVDRLLDTLGGDALRLQLDTYHAGVIGLDVPATIGRYGDRIGHVQVADAPGRHEPGTGTLTWPAIWAALDAVRYGGAIGLEYRPTADLSWLPRSARAWSDAPYAPMPG
jgi:hydroxypyruvate isomerase